MWDSIAVSGNDVLPVNSLDKIAMLESNIASWRCRQKRVLCTPCLVKQDSLGRVSDGEFLDLLQQADMLAHPSLAEGGCNVVYEALACGVPVIVSANGSFAARHEREGIVVPPGDSDMLRAAIERLYYEPQLPFRGA